MALAACILMAGSPLCAQSRKRVSLSSPSIGTVGSSTVSTYDYYSRGVGGLSRPSAGAPASVLSSGIYSTGVTQAQSSLRGPRAGGLGTPVRADASPYSARQSSTASYTRSHVTGSTPGTSLPLTGTSNVTRASGLRYGQAAPTELALPARSEGPSLGVLSSSSTAFSTPYVEALQPSTLESETAAAAKEIRTLAPETPGAFRRMMLQGEADFRRGRYAQAARHFRTALDIHRDSPEAMLELLHTHLASSSEVYELPAYYLQLALQRLPELPLIDVHPKRFYGDPSVYVRDVQRVEQRVSEFPSDASAQFVLGYLKWRDKKYKEAEEALRAALTYGQSSDIKEGVAVLWDGMVATGEVRGELTPLSKKEMPVAPPEPALRPIEPEASTP